MEGDVALSINNPSSRKIKLTISQVAQDKLVPVGLTTMVIWRLPQTKEKGTGALTFRLDNPAMRTDIWSELTAKSLGSKKYQHFKKMIERLSNYTPTNEEPAWISQLQKQLDCLECAIRASQWRSDAVREILLCIYHLEFDQMPQELLNKLYKLYDVDGRPLNSFAQFQQGMEETLDRLERQNCIEQYSKNIYLAYQECNYQRLCFQVEEIHKIIKEESDYVWRWDSFKRFWYRFLRPHFSSILASIALIFLLFLGGFVDKGNYIASTVGVAVGLAPTLLSFLLNKKR